VIGFCIVLLASVFFCFQNVIVRILFHEYSILGLVRIGGFVTPTLHHSFLLMLMRMLWVVPLMAFVAPRLYSPMWKSVSQLREANQRPLLFQSVGCGVLMFLYLALLYVSIGMIPTGVALTLFFTYPVFTALLSWRYFGDRPTQFRWLVMGCILLGSSLTIPQNQASADGYHWLGVVAGIASGVAYAFYTVVAQKSVKVLHPVPFTWISFAVTLGLSFLSLLIWPDNSTDLAEADLAWTPLWIGGFLSAIVTFAGHLMNNYGIRLIGATSAAMIGATNPALTVVLAWWTIQETLNPGQVAGVVIVVLSVALLSREYHKAH
jgi:drug/metabolite transporter (DMT)-like permease